VTVYLWCGAYFTCGEILRPSSQVIVNASLRQTENFRSSITYSVRLSHCVFSLIPFTHRFQLQLRQITLAIRIAQLTSSTMTRLHGRWPRVGSTLEQVRSLLHTLTIMSQAQSKRMQSSLTIALRPSRPLPHSLPSRARNLLSQLLSSVPRMRSRTLIGKQDYDTIPTPSQTGGQTTTYNSTDNDVCRKVTFMNDAGMHPDDTNRSTMIVPGWKEDQILTATKRT
jgi:hypothetical protein